MYYKKLNVKTVNYIYGLGGYDIKKDDIKKVFDEIIEISKSDKEFKVKRYIYNEMEGK